MPINSLKCNGDSTDEDFNDEPSHEPLPFPNL